MTQLLTQHQVRLSRIKSDQLVTVPYQTSLPLPELKGTAAPSLSALLSACVFPTLNRLTDALIQQHKDGHITHTRGRCLRTLLYHIASTKKLKVTTNKGTHVKFKHLQNQGKYATFYDAKNFVIILHI